MEWQNLQLEAIVKKRRNLINKMAFSILDFFRGGLKTVAKSTKQNGKLIISELPIT
jgi:hypothetical protein